MKRILVIEDEPNVRESILDILNSENFYAVSAENGRLGVELVNDFRPDLILCDIMMPELNGHDVLAELRSKPTTVNVPFIFLSAKSDKSDFRQGMDLGADDYLTKPFTHEELLKAINCRLVRQTAIEQESQQKLDNLRHSISFALPHQINTSLSVISGLSFVLMDEYDSVTCSEIYDMAEKIYSSSKQLHRLTQNFLLLAKLELIATRPAQVQKFQQGYLDNATPIIQDVAAQKFKQYQRDLDLDIDLDPLPAPARISEGQLKKIVEELLDNALKFSTDGARVRIFSSRTSARFNLYIVDHGRGMSSDQIQNIGACMQFDRAIQEQCGAGLGLAIVKRLIDLHGGEFMIESILGKQTIVRVSLPN